jgi:ABC-2 type transport system ATP-binding protein
LDLLEKLELADAKDRKLETYSTGMRQRLSLARAMLHRPKILFLDEPTSGLDPESILNVNNIIKGLAKNEGATIFLCTHQLRYAQEICSSYGLIADGAMLAAGSLENLRSMVFPGLIASVKTDRFPKDMAPAKVGERDYEVNVRSEDEIPHIVRRIVEEGGNVYNVTARRMSLEEIYLTLFENKRAERAERKEQND